jgi:hypothetical protein
MNQFGTYLVAEADALEGERSASDPPPNMETGSKLDL